MKKVAIIQSNYIPWKGYFDLIAAVDEFIVYDDMQYTKNDWRNRNILKSPQGLLWLSIPVALSGKFGQLIRETQCSEGNWRKKHWKTIYQCYCKAPCFNEIADWLAPFYSQIETDFLSELNVCLIKKICAFLGIYTKISYSWDYDLGDGKTERLINLCRQAGATEYISGPTAKGYIEEQLFNEADIKLTWFDYHGYPEYSQLWGDFVHEVSILDLLFNCGKNSPKYMRYVG